MTEFGQAAALAEQGVRELSHVPECAPAPSRLRIQLGGLGRHGGCHDQVTRAVMTALKTVARTRLGQMLAVRQAA